MASDDDALVLAGYEDMGYDDEIGARRRGRPRRLAASPMTQNPLTRRRAAQLDAYQSDADGLPLDQVMPFPNGTFTLAIGTLNLVATPQRAFQIRRLVIDQARIGASATGLIQVTQLTVGADPQFVQTGSVPASMFGPTAVGILLKPAAARPGVTVTLSLAVSPLPTTTDTIVMSAAGVGPSIG